MRVSQGTLLTAVAAVAFLAGIGFGANAEPRPTELTTARSLSRLNVELIGFDCYDHENVVLARFEDEFPPCKTIRRLDDERDFL